MILLCNPSYKAFTYIEVSFALLVIVIMVQSMSFCHTAFTMQITKAQMRERLFSIAENLSQSLMVYPLEDEHSTLFHHENISPFQFENEIECTYPIDIEDFYGLFSIQSEEFNPENALQVICAKKTITLTNKPVFQYILYIYQKQGKEIYYGYSTFCQAEK